MFTKTTHRIVIGWLILALLFAQGLRLCLHDHNAPHMAAHEHEASAAHLESTLSVLDGHGEAMTDTHVSLVGILKDLAAEPLVAVVFVMLLLFILPLQQPVVRIKLPLHRIFHLPRGHYCSPPLRAPPR